MDIMGCVILSFILMVMPAHCSSSPGYQDGTALPVRTALLPDVTPERCGEPPNVSKVQQVQQRLRGFPGGRTPLDTLSNSPIKPKRNRPSRMKPSQLKRPAAGSPDQIRTVHSSPLMPVISEDNSSLDQTQLNSRSNQPKLEPTQQSETTERTPSEHLRTKFTKTGSRTGFGLPIDRIGLGRLPSGRR